jgi:hypothetical protein
MSRHSLTPPPCKIVRKLISGGQTGADRAALDVAIELGIPHGGWVPNGRRAEDGPLPPRYHMQETASPDYAVRTEWNVRDADATLIITTDGALTGGTGLTARFAQALGKPYLHVDLSTARHMPRQAFLELLRTWLAIDRPAVLNIAGPRASKDPKIYRGVRRLLLDLFAPTRTPRKPVR